MIDLDIERLDGTALRVLRSELIATVGAVRLAETIMRNMVSRLGHHGEFVNDKLAHLASRIEAVDRKLFALDHELTLPLGPTDEVLFQIARSR